MSEHQEHEHEWQAGPVIEWREDHPYTGSGDGESRDATHTAQAVLLVCRCGETLKVNI